MARAAVVAPSDNLTLTMTPGSVVSGTVLSAQDETPVGAVTVRAVPEMSWNSPANESGVSDSDGMFAVRRLRPGRYRLMAEAEGWRGETPPIDVGLAQSIDHVTVKVAPEARVVGQVLLRATGGPCAQGSVTLGPAQFDSSPYDPPDESDRDASTAPPQRSMVPVLMAGVGAAGEVRFPAVPPGIYHVVVQCDGHRLATGPRTLKVGTSNVEGVTWNVAPGLGMTVWVRDEAEQPQPNAAFRLIWPTRRDGARAAMPLTANGEGRYDVPGVLYPGTYTLEPDGGHTGETVKVELREDSGKVEATLHLPGRSAILLNVKTLAGEPVTQAIVTAQRDSSGGLGDASMKPQAPKISGVSLGAGHYRVGPLEPGQYRVEVGDSVNALVNAKGAMANDPWVRLAGRAPLTLTVTLDRGAIIRGRVEGHDGQPVPDVWVSADCQGPGEDTDRDRIVLSLARAAGTSKEVVTNGEGRFVVAGLARDAVCVLHADQPYGPAALSKDVRPGDPDVRLRLPELGALAGTATQEGRPVPHLTIAIRDDATGQSRSEILSTTDGRFSLERVRPGHLAVVAHDDQGASAETTVDLAPGQRLDGLRLALSPPTP